MGKAEYMMGLLHQFDQISDESPDKDFLLGELLEKNCKKLTYEFSQVLNMAPLAFHGFLPNYLNLARQLVMINWRSDMMVKCSLLMLYYPLKQYYYYCAPDVIVSAVGNKTNSQFQQICHQQFYASFTQEILSQLLHHLLTVVMIREQPEDNLNNIQLLIEEDDINTGIDEILSELDCTIKKLSIVIIEQFLTRFTGICLGLVNDLAVKIVSGD